MLNTSRQVTKSSAASSRLHEPATTVNSSYPTLLSAAVNFNYSTNINTPPCLASSDDEDEDDEKFLSSLLTLTTTNGSSSRATATTASSSGNRQHRDDNGHNTSVSDSNMMDGARVRHMSSPPSLIPRPSLVKPAGSATSREKFRILSADQHATGNGLAQSTKPPSGTAKNGSAGGNPHHQQQHSSKLPEPSATSSSRNNNNRKNFESFIMTGNIMVNKAASPMHFVPHNHASAPQFAPSPYKTDSSVQTVDSNTAATNTFPGSTSSAATCRPVRDDSFQLTDSAIATATTTSSFNEDEESLKQLQQQQQQSFRGQVLREPSSISSNGFGGANNNKKLKPDVQNNNTTASVRADSDDDESGVDLPKAAWRALAADEASEQALGKEQQQQQQNCMQAESVRSVLGVPTSSPFYNLLPDNADDALLLASYETDILDVEPVGVNDDIGNGDNKTSKKFSQPACTTTSTSGTLSPDAESFVDISTNNNNPNTVVQRTIPSGCWNNNNSSACPLPDILLHNSYRIDAGPAKSPAAAVIGWSDIKSAAGDTIAVVSGSDFALVEEEPALVQQNNQTVILKSANDSLGAANSANSNNNSTDNIGKLMREDRPVWTFNATLRSMDGVQANNNKYGGMQQQSPATRSVPASPATYRRGYNNSTAGAGMNPTAAVVAAGGSLSSTAGKRVGRLLASNNNNANSAERQQQRQQLITVMPFLRLKSFDNNAARLNNNNNSLLTPSHHSDNCSTVAPSVTPGSTTDTALCSFARSLYYLKGCTPVEVAGHIISDEELKQIYLNLHNFSGLNLEIALRQFTDKVCLLGTAQQKVDLLERFAQRFFLTYDEEFEYWYTSGAGAGDTISSQNSKSGNNSSSSKLYVSQRTTFFASLALVIVSSYLFQQQLASSSAASSRSNNLEVESSSSSNNSDDDDNGDEGDDAVPLPHQHTRERHAAGSRHPKPGCLEHLPSISAYTVRYDDNEAEEDSAPNGGDDAADAQRSAIERTARQIDLLLQSHAAEQQQQQQTVNGSSSSSPPKRRQRQQQQHKKSDSAGDKKNEQIVPLVIKSQNASLLLTDSTEANRWWTKLNDDLLPLDERVPLREQKRLRAAICTEPLPVRLSEEEIKFFFQYASHYEPPSLQSVSEVLLPSDNKTGTDAEQAHIAPQNLSTELHAAAAAANDKAVSEAVVVTIIENAPAAAKSATMVDNAAFLAILTSIQTNWPPYTRHMQRGLGDILRVKQRCGPQGSHLKWWRRRWHRRLLEVNELLLIERRPALARKSLDNPKRQRPQHDDVFLSLHHAWCERAVAGGEGAGSGGGGDGGIIVNNYGPNVLQLFLHNGSIRLLRYENEQQTVRWQNLINMNAAFSAPVKVPVTNDPTCTLSASSSKTNTIKQINNMPSTVITEQQAALAADLNGTTNKAAAGSSNGAATWQRTLMSSSSSKAPPRFFPDCVTTFNEHQQLAEWRDYLSRCQRDMAAVLDEERELRQTKTLSLHGSLRRSARRHTKHLLQTRSAALRVRKCLLETEMRRTRVYIDTLQQLVVSIEKNDAGPSSSSTSPKQKI